MKKQSIQFALVGLMVMVSPIWAQLGGLEIDLSGNASLSAEKSHGYPLEMSGFVDLRYGVRTQSPIDQDAATLGELRLNTQFEKRFQNGGALILEADILNADPSEIDLETGQGILDLRKAYYSIRPMDQIDIKVGRQILTWGTGDLLFVNDMFPKDWNSFLLGRDQSYLKAPSDALKVSIFGDKANIDLVYSPQFDADRFIDGRTVSYFNGQSVVGGSQLVSPQYRDSWGKNAEYAARIYHNFGSVEAAVYGYNGYWKSPVGLNQEQDYYFPELSVVGASLRAPFWKGIGSVEWGTYLSNEDSSGTDSMVPNSEDRLLIGYEQSLSGQRTVSTQVYLESMRAYSAYKDNLPDGAVKKDQLRWVHTLRVTQILYQERLTLSLFNFYSPSDSDGYLRFSGRYKWSDPVKLEVGGNCFYGDSEGTFFGQFESNSNLYLAWTRSF